MTASKKLTPGEIVNELASLDGWNREGDKLHRTFVFADFVTAFSFMTGAALVAEKLDHHPEWFNVYKTVRVHLATHDAGGITAKDFQLARAMDASRGRSLRNDRLLAPPARFERAPSRSLICDALPIELRRRGIMVHQEARRRAASRGSHRRGAVRSAPRVRTGSAPS
jgi:4a-hydroxytetrahydrobiopterin dehydratase